jgi:DNA-binding NarL/FixJ family response regulator
VAEAPIRVLMVDDHRSWRKFASTTLEKGPDSKVIGEASDGIEAIQLSEQLQPDLILLDIGLPHVSGIEAARQIRRLCPTTKILFMSENRSADIAEEALGTGAVGYVVKSDAGSELLPAIKAVLEGKQFISSSLTGYLNAPQNNRAATATHRHEVEFYPDDISVVDGYARFIEYALSGGNAIIVVVTESHRATLVSKLQANGVNVAAAIAQGSYVSLDAADAMASLTVNDTPDPVRCAQVIGDVVTRAAKAVRGGHARVMVCGEIAPTMLAKGNVEGAIQLEHLWGGITRDYGVHTHCGYVWSASPRRESKSIFERICAQHSAVHGRELGH